MSVSINKFFKDKLLLPKDVDRLIISAYIELLNVNSK